MTCIYIFDTLLQNLLLKKKDSFEENNSKNHQPTACLI